jgi:hypothetical protein
MANRIFTEQRTYERRLIVDGTLRRRAVTLFVIGAGFTVVGVVNRDPFAVTVGLIGVAAGAAWRWYLTAEG